MMFLGSKSIDFLKALSKLRSGEKLSHLPVGNLSADQRLYLLAEYAVQVGQYSLIETGVSSRDYVDSSAEMIQFVRTYRDLFTNPDAALANVEDLLSQDRKKHMLDSAMLERMIFWRTHLKLLLGRIDDRSEMRAILESPISYSEWRAELLAIRALGFYFLNDPRAAISAHAECEFELTVRPNAFISLFNAAMGCRASLCERDSVSFQLYLNRLESALSVNNDHRYRLRYLSYRALAYEQLYEVGRAQHYWDLAAEEISQSESELEKYHFYLARGIAVAMRGKFEESDLLFDLASKSLKLSGNPQRFRDDWFLAKGLVRMAGARLNRLPLVVQLQSWEFGKNWFVQHCGAEIASSGIAQLGLDVLNAWYSQLDGAATVTSRSFVLDVIFAYNDRELFAKQKDRFRYVSRFVDRLLRDENSDNDSLSILLGKNIREVTGLDVAFEDGRLVAAKTHEELAHDPEMRSVFKIANLWLSLRQNEKRLARIDLELSLEKQFRYLAEQVAHDLCSPLAAIKMVIPVISDTDSDCRRILESSVERISDTVSDISSKKMPQLRLHSDLSGRDTNEPAGLMFESINLILLQKEVEHPNVRIVADFGGMIALEDRERLLSKFPEAKISTLVRVISNLINNAVQASAKNIMLRFDALSVNGVDGISIEIKDDGGGMPHHVLSHVGTRGFTTKGEQGSGLGLFHADEFAKSMNGRMTIKSEESKGTIITFKLMCNSQATYRMSEATGGSLGADAGAYMS